MNKHLLPDPEPISASEALEVSDPRSIVNLLTPKIREKLLEVPGELFQLSEAMLLKWFRRHDIELTAVDHRLRIKLWDEYHLTQDEQRSAMNLRAIFHGVCSKQFFYQIYLNEPRRLAWLLCQPPEYEVEVKRLHEKASKEMEKILAIDHFNHKGEPNSGLIAKKIQLYKILDDRMKGAVLQKVQVDQRVDQRSLNFNVDKPPEKEFKSPAEIDRELAKLEREEQKALGHESDRRVIDVESERIDESKAAPTPPAKEET